MVPELKEMRQTLKLCTVQSCARVDGHSRNDIVLLFWEILNNLVKSRSESLVITMAQAQILRGKPLTSHASIFEKY